MIPGRTIVTIPKKKLLVKSVELMIEFLAELAKKKTRKTFSKASDVTI